MNDFDTNNNDRNLDSLPYGQSLKRLDDSLLQNGYAETWRMICPLLREEIFPQVSVWNKKLERMDAGLSDLELKPFDYQRLSELYTGAKYQEVETSPPTCSRDREAIKSKQSKLLTIEPTVFFGLTSGTTSHLANGARACSNSTQKFGKKIPYNLSMIKSMARTNAKVMRACLAQSKQKAPLAIALGSPAQVGVFGGAPAGFVSGILAEISEREIGDVLIPVGFVDGKSLTDLAAEVLEKSAGRRHLIGSITGVTVGIYSLLSEIARLEGVTSILEVFPHMEFFVYGGTPVTPFESSLEKLFGGSLPKLGGLYFSTEAPIGLPDPCFRIDRYCFNPEVIVSLRKPGQEKLEFAYEAEEEQTYEVFVTTFSGLVCFPIGDVIYLHQDRSFSVLGRSDMALNLATEKVLISDLQAISSTELCKHRVFYEHFLFCPSDSATQPSYELHVFLQKGSDPSAMLKKALEDSIEARLALHYKDYQEVREMGFLGKLQVKWHQGNGLLAYSLFMSSTGQYKNPPLFRSRDAFLKYMEALADYAKSH